MDVVRRAREHAVVGRGREVRGPEDVRGDAGLRQALVERRRRRAQEARIGTRAQQRVARGVARVAEQQRRDERVERRLVDVPLVQAVLADRDAGVQRGDVRGGRRRELRGQRRDRVEAPQQRVVAVAGEEAPAEGVEQDERRRAARARAGRRGRRRPPLRRAGAPPCPAARRSRRRRSGGRPSDRPARLAEHLAQPRGDREVALHVHAAGQQRLAGVEVAAGHAHEVDDAQLERQRRARSRCRAGRSRRSGPSVTVQLTSSPSERRRSYCRSPLKPAALSGS